MTTTAVLAAPPNPAAMATASRGPLTAQVHGGNSLFRTDLWAVFGKSLKKGFSSQVAINFGLSNSTAPPGKPVFGQRAQRARITCRALSSAMIVAGVRP